MTRDEIDARQHRCDEAKLRPSTIEVRDCRIEGPVEISPLDFGGDPSDASIRILSRDEADRLGPMLPVEHLLSFEEAQIAGQVMHDHWERMVEEGDPPLVREDHGWADLARQAWEAVWAFRRAK